MADKPKDPPPHLRLVHSATPPSSGEDEAEAGDSPANATVALAPEESGGVRALRYQLGMLAYNAKGGEIDGEMLNEESSRLVLEHLEANGCFVAVGSPRRVLYVQHEGARIVEANGRGHAWKDFIAELMDATPGKRLQTVVARTSLRARASAQAVVTASLSAWDGHSFLIAADAGRVLRVGPDGPGLTPNPCAGHLLHPSEDWRLPTGDVLGATDDDLPWLRDFLTAGWSFDPGAAATPEEQGALVLAWSLMPLVGELVPVRPILLAQGPEGAGKSTGLRSLGRLLLGDSFDVTEPGTAADFRAMTCAMPLVILDNVDSPTAWMEDALCRASTGQAPATRKKYTTNDLVRHRQQALVGLTARTPHFRRRDVADRMLIIRLARRGTKERPFASERHLAELTRDMRPIFWRGAVACLREVAARQREGLEPMPFQTRLADFAQVGAAICDTMGLRDAFIRGLEAMERERTAFTTGERPSARPDGTEGIRAAMAAWARSDPEGAAHGLPARDLARLLPTFATGNAEVGGPPLSAVGLGRVLSRLSQQRGGEVIVEQRVRDGNVHWTARIRA